MAPLEAPTLIDSNVFISLLRQGRDPAATLTQTVSPTELATCGMVRLEVMRGLKSSKVSERLDHFLDVLQNVPTDQRLWKEAASLAWSLDRMGKILPAQDILIAACALRIGAVVLTVDRHFSQIPGLRVRWWAG